MTHSVHFYDRLNWILNCNRYELRRLDISFLCWLVVKEEVSLSSRFTFLGYDVPGSQFSSGFRRVILAKPRGEEIHRASDAMKYSASARTGTKRLGWFSISRWFTESFPRVEISTRSPYLYSISVFFVAKSPGESKTEICDVSTWSD